MTIGDLFNIADKAGVIFLLIVAFVGGVKRWWVFGWVHRDAEAREDEWKQLALTGTKLAEKVATLPRAEPKPPPTIDEILAALRTELGER